MAAALVSLAAADVGAAPAEESCRLLAAIGAGDAAGIQQVVQQVAGHWTEESRESMRGELVRLVGNLSFAGGSVYRTGTIGEELEDYLLVLRLRDGEVAGLRLSFEWYPDGLKLRTLDFRRRVQEFWPGLVTGTLAPLDCAGG